MTLQKFLNLMVVRKIGMMQSTSINTTLLDIL